MDVTLEKVTTGKVLSTLDLEAPSWTCINPSQTGWQNNDSPQGLYSGLE